MVSFYFNRGKTEGVETYGVVLTNSLTVAVCGDTCLRAWALDEGGAPAAVSPPLSQTLIRPKPPRKHFVTIHFKSINFSNCFVLFVSKIDFLQNCT